MEKHIEDAFILPPTEIPSEQSESIEENKFSEMISQYLNDDSFIEKLSQIKYESQKGNFIGEVVEYLILHRNTEGVDVYVDGLLNRKETKFEKGDLLIESVKSKLGIETLNNDLSDEEAEKIYQYIYERRLRDGYVFHGFNGVFEASIRENGLDQSKASWEFAELEEVGEISRAYGVSLVGQHYANIGEERFTSSGKNYYDETSQFFYTYAANSPEWFSQFCNVGKNNGTYHKRHYEEARANIEECIGKIKARPVSERARPFTGDDERKILDFFEKYWKKFVTESPGLRLGLVHRKAITETPFDKNKYERDLNRESWSAMKSRPKSQYESLDPRPENIKLISQLLYETGQGGNHHVNYKISPDLITIVDLPTAEKIFD
ncbi:MAG: hypothetical protein JWP09_343 [Candidatus Taylorbacteria bacterium]|nr:hypothetical protein [Candidatus Taylorbacteria bacterium]